MALSKGSALRLANHALSEGAVALRGRLAHGEDGQMKIGDRSVSEWLGQYEGYELILIAAPMDASLPERNQSCNVCGRDYEGPECPYCSRARARLRGR
jgi:hypothetical protein